VNERVNEASEESDQHLWLFPSAFDKICIRREDNNIFFEDCITGLDFNFGYKKLEVCLIIPAIPDIMSPVLLTDRVRGRECCSLVLAALPVGRFKEGFISAKAP